MISLTEILDTFVRAACIGQLALISVALLKLRPLTMQSKLLLALIPCVVAYLLLTAPIKGNYIAWRGFLLTLTHALPVLVWALGLEIFNSRLRPSQWSRPAIAMSVVLIAVHALFFGLIEDNGWLHDTSHIIYLILLSHLVLLSIGGMPDDLRSAGRRARALVLVFFGVQSLVIVATELTDLRPANPHIFSAVNAGLFLLVTFFVGAHLLSSNRSQLLLASSKLRQSPQRSKTSDISPGNRLIHAKLVEFMNSGGYRMMGLSIKRLADELTVPEHRLRQLINQDLGYRNFSSFLNSYRIEDACGKLKDLNLADVSVLTIALESGYGSIGPFNRAFKTNTGQTPTEFRKRNIQ